ncbi:MAG: ABC transporter ATP-binding protein [Planctomycetes bacterium]|nr:ABC transporter ATP-binding protein [Planctomycetota bacterium]
MLAIEISDLCKSYGSRTVLHNVDLAVRSGAIFGFLGPNGAGKTTTIRTLLGLLRADGGRALIFGRDAWREGPTARASVGYLPGDVRFYDWFTGRTTLEMYNASRGGGHRDEMLRLQRAFDLELDKKVRRYSRGMKQKLGLIQALMHRPRLLILDEPTTALDPLVRETLVQELRTVAADGRSVLFSSHTLSEVEELCDEVAIVRAGRIIENEKIAVLQQRAVRHVEFIVDPRRVVPPAPSGLRILSQADGRTRGAWAGPVQPLLSWLAGIGVQDVSIAPPDLEDLFLAYYSNNNQVSAA